jgi:hypothetical protein
MLTMKTLDSWLEGACNMSETKMDELLSLIRELVKWSKFGGKLELKRMLTDNLEGDSEKLVYEYSDGERSSRDIEKETGIGRASIQRHWEKWFKMGIMEASDRYEGRMMHICSLGEVGIETPSPPSKRETQQSPPAISEGATSP